MEEQRALLNQLMGINRDGDKPDLEILDFRDSRICKSYLAGLCMADLFLNTKMDMGECSCIHDPDMKKMYEKARENKDFGYESTLEKELIKHHTVVVRKIQSSQRRLVKEGTGEKEIVTSKEVLEATILLQEALVKVEDAGLEGNVTVALECMREVEEYVKQRAHAEVCQNHHKSSQ